MAKTPLDKQIEKARKEAQRNAYKEELRQRAASIVSSQPIINGVRIIDDTAETVLNCLLENCKDSSTGHVSYDNDIFPQAVSRSIGLEIEKLIQQLEKQITELKAELKTLRGEDATVEGDIVYQDDSVIVTYNGLKENEYGDGYTINFIIENLTDKKINVGYDDESINGFMCYTGFYADIVAGKKTKEVIDMYEDSDDYCPMEELESLEFCVVVSDADTYDEISTSDPVVINFAN